MKRYYKGLFFCLFIVTNAAFAIELDEAVVQNEQDKQIEIDVCQDYNLDKKDEMRQLIENFSDEKVIKIISYCKLLERNHSLYLCEIDKIIGNWFNVKNKCFTLNNVMRLLKATVFFACSSGCAYVGFNAWKNGPNGELSKNKYTVGLFAVATLGSLCGMHCLTELHKVYSNYDQNQLYYKAIAIKDALLNYRKT